MRPCRYRDTSGRCKKGYSNAVCHETYTRTFDDGFCTIEREDVCEASSIYGNRYISITMEDISALLEGKVLCSIDEYGTFIALKGGEDDE